MKSLLWLVMQQKRRARFHPWMVLVAEMPEVGSDTSLPESEPQTRSAEPRPRRSRTRPDTQTRSRGSKAKGRRAPSRPGATKATRTGGRRSHQANRRIQIVDVPYQPEAAGHPQL